MTGRGEAFTHGAEQRVALCEVERRIVVRGEVLPPAVLLSVVDLEEEADDKTGASDERRVRLAVAAGDAQRRQLAAKVARAERARRSGGGSSFGGLCSVGGDSSGSGFLAASARR